MIERIILSMAVDYYKGLDTATHIDDYPLLRHYASVVMFPTLYVFLIISLGTSFMAQRKAFNIIKVMQWYNVGNSTKYLHICWDPRTADLPITNSYPAVLLIIATYVLLVKKIGPAFMAKRKPYNIRRLIITYNFAQVMFNSIMFIVITRNYIFHPKYSWSCMACDRTDFSKESMTLRTLGYLYFWNKVADCVDTVFFVLTKKFSHITLLHVYHHATMVWGSFLYVNVFFASQFSIIGYVNSLVHALMYFYYLLSSLKVNVDLSVWKPRMTQFQLLQFFYYAVKLAVPLTNNWCGLSKFWLWTVFLENVIMIGLFAQFYYKSYIAKKPKAKEYIKKK